MRRRRSRPSSRAASRRTEASGSASTKPTRRPADFQRLVDRLKSGHISAPLNPLVISYGGVPAEAVIRSMYYAGQLERRHGLDFPLAVAMESSGMPYGLGALWAGSGAEYSWKGVCNCPTETANPGNRQAEIYNWVGPDGSRILTKWNSLHDPANNESIGGYAEARAPSCGSRPRHGQRGRERVRDALPVLDDRRLRTGLGRRRRPRTFRSSRRASRRRTRPEPASSRTPSTSSASSRRSTEA